MTLLNAILQNDTVKVLVLDNQKSFVEYSNLITAITSIVAILLSVFGLFYSVYYNRKSLRQSEDYNRKTLEQTIRHNTLSVVPILAISKRLVSETKTINIEIVNCGLGTAIITEISLIYNDITYLRNDFKQLLVNNNINSNTNARIHSFTDKCPISSNQRIPIFTSDIVEDYNYHKINDIFNNTKISVDYLTLYNEKRNHTDSL